MSFCLDEVLAPHFPSGSALFEHPQLAVRRAQTIRQRVRELLEDPRAERRIVSHQRIEALAREHVELSHRGRFDVRRPPTSVEKRDLAEEVAPADGGQMMALPAFERQQHVHPSAADEENFVAFVALGKDSASGRD